MTNEIKFRAWDLYNKKMIDIGDLETIFITDKDLDFANYKVMQYTGLKDKNGKEIYCGDIVKYKYVKNDIAVVNWDDELLTNKITIVSDGIYCEDYFFIKSDSSKYEVIGNKFENSNLLK